EAGVARDRAVDADHLAADVDEWSAGVPGVDRRIRLDVILNRVWRVEKRAERTATRAHDSRGHREVQAYRIADGNDPLSNLRVRIVAERHRREVAAIHLDHGDVGGGIAADHLGGEGAVVEQ